VQGSPRASELHGHQAVWAHWAGRAKLAVSHVHDGCSDFQAHMNHSKTLMERELPNTLGKFEFLTRPLGSADPCSATIPGKSGDPQD
jgi:hypothetical protein